MLRAAAAAFILAIIAAAFGQGGLSNLATRAAMVLALIAVVMLVIGLLGGRDGTPPAV